MVIDSDAHINESLDELAERLDAPYRSRAPRLLQDTLGLTRILMEGRLYPDPRLRQRHSRNVQGKDLGGIHRGAADPRCPARRPGHRWHRRAGRVRQPRALADDDP